MKKTKMKRSWVLSIVVLSVVLFLCAGPTFAASKAPQNLRLGTAGSGGTWYYVGSAVSTVISKYVPDVKLTPVATAGGLENIRRLYQGDLDFCITGSANISDAAKDKTAGPDKISILAGVHSTIDQLVVRADYVKAKGIKTAGDFLVKGVKMSIGEPGSTLQAGTRVLLAAFGLKLEDVNGQQLSQANAAEAFKDGHIQGMFLGGGIPTASVVNATQSVDAVVLPFTEADIKKVQGIAAYQFGYIVPEKTYRGQDKPFLTVAYPSMVLCRSNLDDNVIYNFIKAMHDHVEEIATIHPAGKEWGMESVYRGADWAKSFGYKFHPGVIKYLKEKKNWNPKYE